METQDKSMQPKQNKQVSQLNTPTLKVGASHSKSKLSSSQKFTIKSNESTIKSKMKKPNKCVINSQSNKSTIESKEIPIPPIPIRSSCPHFYPSIQSSEKDLLEYIERLKKVKERLLDIDQQLLKINKRSLELRKMIFKYRAIVIEGLSNVDDILAEYELKTYPNLESSKEELLEFIEDLKKIVECLNNHNKCLFKVNKYLLESNKTFLQETKFNAIDTFTIESIKCMVEIEDLEHDNQVAIMNNGLSGMLFCK